MAESQPQCFFFREEGLLSTTNLRDILYFTRFTFTTLSTFCKDMLICATFTSQQGPIFLAFIMVSGTWHLLRKYLLNKMGVQHHPPAPPLPPRSKPGALSRGIVHQATHPNPQGHDTAVLILEVRSQRSPGTPGSKVTLKWTRKKERRKTPKWIF